MLLSDGKTASPVDDTSALPTVAVPLDVPLQTEAQSLLDYSQTLITGEDIMFTMDVPYVPPQQTPIVLVQADTSGASATSQPDYILKDCQETESTGDSRSAMRAVDPAGLLAVYLQQYKGAGFIDLSAIKNVTLLEGTTHGNIFSGVDNTGRTSYHYDPEPEYIGNDKAVFMAEYQGVRYKIMVDLHVFSMVDEKAPSSCPPPKLIKVNGKPVSGALSSDINVSMMDSLSIDPSLVTLNIADLPGGAVGQTVGTNITLDDNAAGYGWFIDTTPTDNSEFLPTSNPNEWVAKAGSEAELKGPGSN